MGKGQELLDAAREGDRKTVEKILAQITKRSGPFTSLRRGAGVNVQDDNGYTPLHHACLRGHKDIVRLLLSVDASPCIVDKKGATPLHLAAWKGDADVVSALLAHNNPSLNIDQLTSDQETALLIAAQFGNVDVVAQLVARGADVTARNIKDESALDLAAQYGRLDTVQHLLRARPQLVDQYKFPVCRGRLFSSTPLHRASKNGHKEVVATLIAAGIDPNVRTYSGTALHEAANYGKESVVRILLSKGADLNAADRRGRTVRDLLDEYSEEATKRVRRIIREHIATNGYESEEDLPPFPVQDYSPTGYPMSVGMKAPKTQKQNHSLSQSSSASSLTKINPQNLVQKLALKCKGLKAKFSNSTPNISNTSRVESDVTQKRKNINSKTNITFQTGNSMFFKGRSKKDECGDIDCTDEFDTISLDRVATLDRTAPVNRSNRSCPGFKTSLQSIAENAELSDSHESCESIVIVEMENCNINKLKNEVRVPIEAINKAKLTIFEPREPVEDRRASNLSAESAVNECYESIEKLKNKNVVIVKPDLVPKPTPRPYIAERKNSNEDKTYENIEINPKVIPTPAVRSQIAPKIGTEKKIVYENVTPKPEARVNIPKPEARVNIPKPDIILKPEPPKRTILPVAIQKVPENKEHQNIQPPKRTLLLEIDKGSNSSLNSTQSLSGSSTMSSDSMADETNLEDILLSKKSTSFKLKNNISLYANTRKFTLSRSQSIGSESSEGTEASAIDNIDCSVELDEKSMYLSMTGTLPGKKAEREVKKKVLFRHKTFTNIEADRTSISKDFPKWNNEFLKETLASYHIRGTGHCIYKSPTVKEFMDVFNRDTLYSDVAPFDKVPKRESYFETAICFCKPSPPKHHKSAEDLLELPLEDDAKVSIDIDELRKLSEMHATSFKCFCDDGTCKFHSKKRDKPNNLIVKFSAIKKSISTPDITLNSTPPPTAKRFNLFRKNSVPNVLEDPYAVTSIEDILARKRISDARKEVEYCTMSQPSTMSSGSRPYSVKDIAEEISLRDASDSSLKSNASGYVSQIRKSSSDHSGHLSLQSCQSDVTITSDMSFKSCEEADSSDDDTVQSDDDDSDTNTVKSDASTSKRPWVHSDSFRFNSNESQHVIEESKGNVESGIETGEDVSSSDGARNGSVLNLEGGSLVASLECAAPGLVVRSGSGRRRWDEGEGASEGDALSLSSAASSCAPHHLGYNHDYSKVSPTPPKKPPRRNLSVSPTHANSPSSGYSYELRTHARSQDDLDDLQGAKHYLKHGRSIDQYVDGKLSYSEYEENHNSPRVAPIPNPRPSLKNRTQPVAITAMYDNVVLKEQNPRRKLKRNSFTPQYENFEPRMENRVRKYSAQERSSLESLLDDSQSINSPSDCDRYSYGSRVDMPASPTHYEQPPTPDHPPPSAKQAENSIHERIRPLSQLIMEVVEEIRIRKKSQADITESS